MSFSTNRQEEMSRVPDENEALLATDFRRMPEQRNKQKCPKCCTKCCLVSLVITLVVSGAVAIAVGLTLRNIDDSVQSMVASKVALTKGSESVKQWSDPEAVVHFIVNMFNVTNKDDFMNHGKKLAVKEVGPFFYREYKVKYNLNWNDDESILGYMENCTYVFNRSESGFDPNTTNITTLNLPLMGILVQFEKLQDLVKDIKHPLVKKLLNDVIKGLDEALRKEFKENLFITRSVHDIVWGYHDPFLQFVADMLPKSLDIPNLPKDGKFYLEHLSSTTGPNMVYTGKHNSMDTARFLMYDGKTSIKGWGNAYASMINGTEAIIFHPGVDKTQNLSLYVSELFRSGYFSYYKDVDEFGVKMLQYRLPPDLLSGKYKYSDGFNMYGPDGALNLTAVYPLNVPVFVTKPHFLDAPEYKNNVTGMNPIRDKHDAFLNVEPITGAVLHAAKRLQINIQLARNKNISEFKSLPELTYLPLLWVDEGAQLNSTQASDFKHTVYVPLHAIDGVALGVASVAGFIGVLSCLLLFILATYTCEKAVKRRVRNQSISVRFDD